MLAAIRRRSWDDTAPSSEPDIPLHSISAKQDRAPLESLLDLPPDPPIEPSPNPKQERSNQLLQDLLNSKSECPICSDTLLPPSPLWSCLSCHHIYHFPCIKRWASKYSSKICWPCPTCKCAQSRAANDMIACCWCGRTLHVNIENEGNTCGEICGWDTKCESNVSSPCQGSCGKICHPGPCEEVICDKNCISLKAKSSLKTPKKAKLSGVHNDREEGTNLRTPRARARRADEDSNTVLQPRDREVSELSTGDSVCGTITGLIFLALFQAPFWYWQTSRIDRYIKPLEHKHFTEHTRDLEGILNILFSLLFTITLFSILGMGISAGVCYSLTGIFKFAKRHWIGRFLMGLFTFAFCVLAIWNVVILAFIGPDPAWRNQMRHSCDGFDTRIKLDKTTKVNKTTRTIPSTKITLFDPSLPNEIHAPGINEFEFSTSTSPYLQPTQSFHTYHRMNGILASSPSTPITVDFDLSHHVWRILHLPSSSMSQTNNITSPIPPSSIIPFKNGTWTATTPTTPNILIPELDLEIPEMYYYTQNCVYQAFMKIYSLPSSTSNFTSTSTTSNFTIPSTWSPKNTPEVLLRTAAFSSSSDGGIEICARQQHYVVDGEERNGIGEDIVVPVGLLAVLRLRMFEQGTLGRFGCNWVG